MIQGVKRITCLNLTFPVKKLKMARNLYFRIHHRGGIAVRSQISGTISFFIYIYIYFVCGPLPVSAGI